MSEEFIIPTGKIIKEYLEEYGINQKELCHRIGMSEKHVSNLLNGNCRLTEDFALKLEKVLTEIPASYWLNYESKYRELLARNEELYKINQSNLEDTAKKFRFKDVFDGLGLTLVEQAIEMLKLLKISDFENFHKTYSNLLVDFMEDGGEKELIGVWLNLCESEIEIQNEELKGTKYNSKELEENLRKFKIIAYNADVQLSISSCRKLCNKLGIYLVLCNAIPNSKVRGALTTYKGNPAIYLSGRFKSHDHIWFAFIHELGHLLKHYNKKDIFIALEDSDNEVNQKEIEADEFARDFFINKENYREFISNLQITKESIFQFSKEEKILPGILIARLQHDGIIPYDEYSYLK